MASLNLQDSQVPQHKMKCTILELNEFNEKLLKSFADKYHLKNIQKLFKLSKSATSTKDSYESDYLEPWVQWVSVHTGKNSQGHKVKHLGDVPDLKFKQLWEELSDSGISSGVWGVMNGSRNEAKHCLFFLPDPWTFSEKGFPEEIDHFLWLPRYIAKNYLKLSIRKMFYGFYLFVRNSLKLSILKKLFIESPQFLKGMIKFKFSPFVFIFFADYLYTLFFIHYKKKFHPQCNILFLNAVAHMQHHHWKKNPHNHEKILFGLKVIDLILNEIYKNLEDDEVFLCLNALSQMNTDHEPIWILYKLYDQQKFLKDAGIEFAFVENLMTYDAHIFFDNREKLLHAKDILMQANVSSKKVFLVEENPLDPLKLFYRINFTDQIGPQTLLNINHKNLVFISYFRKITERSGRHTPSGSVFYKGINLPKRIMNHDLYNEITKCMVQKST